MNTLGEFVPIENIHQGSCWKRRVVYSPSIHVEERRTVEGRLIEGKGNRESNEQWRKLGDQRFAHRSRHLNPEIATPPPFVVPTPDDPPDQPHFFETQQQDWDLWVKHRDLIFMNKGIHRADPAWDRVYALAEDLWTWRFTIQKPGGNDFSKEMPWSEPTATLMYGSWCAGCAPTLVALCATIGVPARYVDLRDHGMCEAWIDGQWNLADNVTAFHKAGGNMMVHGSLAEMLLDPTNPRWEFIDEQVEKYWEKTPLSVASSTGRYHEEPWQTFLTPQTALALYPGWVNPEFKSAKPRTCDLVWGRSGLGHPFLICRQGQAFRRRFRLGSLAETDALVVTFCGEGGRGETRYAHHNVPTDGGDWFIAVNGRRHPVREQGGWDFHNHVEPADPFYASQWQHRFEVPTAELIEHDWNEIAIGCPGTGDQFLRFSGRADWLLPEEHCLCRHVT